MNKFFVILFLLVSPLVFTQEIQTEPDTYWKNTKFWETRFTGTTLIESSLVASGLKGDELNLYIKKYNKTLADFKNHIDQSFNSLSKYEKGEFLLNWAHKNVLKEYFEEQTRMDTLIDTGRYNCVSSAIFYLILSREAGLNTETIETIDHAFCSVETDSGWIDVETTTAYGFEPGLKREFQQSFNQTGYTYVPPGNYRNRNQINDKEAVSLIIQNRMSILQKHNDHAPAVGLAIDRWTLWDDDNNYRDMNDSFKNWAAVLNNRDNYREAFEFLNLVSKIYNLTEVNSDLLYDLAYNQLITYTNMNNYSEAENFLLTTKNSINTNDYSRLEKLFVREQVSYEVVNTEYKESIIIVRDSYGHGSIIKKDWKNWVTVLNQKEALLIADNYGWWSAWEFLKGLPEEEKAIPNIKRSIRTAHENWSIVIHNQFAELFNSREYTQAKKLLMEALNQDPENTYLVNDLKELKKKIP
jgi:tetratricopeptide (TPR) repeat protein